MKLAVCLFFLLFFFFFVCIFFNPSYNFFCKCYLSVYTVHMFLVHICVG